MSEPVAPDVARAPDVGRKLGAIIAVGVVARVGIAWYLGDRVEPMPGILDQVSYHQLALRVLGGHGFSFGTGWWPATAANAPTAHWSYLYVLFLAGIYSLVGPHATAVRLLQAVAVGVLQPLLTFRIGSRLFGTRVGLVSAAVVSVYAYFAYYAGALMTESFHIVAILWSLDAAIRLAGATDHARGTGASWFELGVALAVAVLLRQVMLLLVPVVLGWVIWRATRQGAPAIPSRERLRASLRGASIALLVIAASIVPWTIRNYRAFDTVVPLNTNAGFAFFWGNHPIHGRRFVPILPGEDTYGRLIPAELRRLDEARLDQALLRRGLGFIAADPGRFVALSFSRLREYVKFWPEPDSSALSNYARLGSFGLLLPFLLVGIVLVVRDRQSARRGSGLLFLVAAGYAGIHLLTWTLIRYRLPVDAILVPCAAVAIVRVCESVSGRVRSVRAADTVAS